MDTPHNPMKRIGIMGGSFNPVHIGHIVVADYIAQECKLDEVWLVLSPLNPLKAALTDQLIDDSARFDMLKIAAAASPRLAACDIELTMPRPSYTIDTLHRLSKLYPDYSFTLIIGSDNWEIFPRWRSGDEILRDYGVVVYPRPGHAIDYATVTDDVTIVDAPQFEVSSTFIRWAISAGYDMTLLLPAGVIDYITAHGLYGAKVRESDSLPCPPGERESGERRVARRSRSAESEPGHSGLFPDIFLN